MPRLMVVADTSSQDLDQCIEALSASGFAPRDEESLAHAALQLRRLGNNRNFLGDMLVAELAAHHREDLATHSYGPQTILLSPPGGHPDFFLRANIWPSRDEHSLRASGGGLFAYGMAHDHNFDFLTLGYFGPGYWSDAYEYDYEQVTGWKGERVALRFTGRERLEEGRIVHYRAHRDVHEQHPPASLSVSLNIMHTSGAQGWLDQYAFDLDSRCVARILGAGASEAFIRIAVALGGEEARDIAHRFARAHSSDRMRLHAWAALAADTPDAEARDALWREAENSGSRLVAGEAGLRRQDRG